MNRLALVAILALLATPAHADAGADWVEISASTDDAQEQFDLAMQYYSGHGMPQDQARALELFGLAAEQGLVDAQFKLATIYLNSESAAHDYTEAARLFRLAAEQNDPRAQYILGIMHQRGDGVAQDLIRAHMWFDLAALSGFGKAANSRDDLSLEMTIDEISEARRLFHERADTHQASTPTSSD